MPSDLPLPVRQQSALTMIVATPGTDVGSERKIVRAAQYVRMSTEHLHCLKRRSTGVRHRSLPQESPLTSSRCQGRVPFAAKRVSDSPGTGGSRSWRSSAPAAPPSFGWRRWLRSSHLASLPLRNAGSVLDIASPILRIGNSAGTIGEQLQVSGKF